MAYELVTLAEAKKRLSIDFNERDNEIQGRVNAIKGYLTYATGIKESEYENMDTEAQSIAKEYVLMRLYYDYYGSELTELANMRMTAMVKQLQLIAL